MSEILEGHYSDGTVRFHIAAYDANGDRVDIDYTDLFDLILDKLGGSPCDDEPDTELEQLRRWKAEAIITLATWEQVWLAAGQPGPLGTSKAANTLRFLNDLIDPPQWPGRGAR